MHEKDCSYHCQRDHHGRYIGFCCFSSMHGQLSGNHFLTITEGLESLYDFGRKVLYEGAQPIEVVMIES